MSGVKAERIASGPRASRGRRKRSRVRVWLEYGAFRLVAAGFRNASNRSLDRWSRRVGRLASRLLAKRTRLALTNLSRVFPSMPEEERRSIVAACWRYYALSVFEHLRSIDEPIESVVERFLNIPDLLQLGGEVADRGAIVVTAHLGSWESAIAPLSLLERPIAVVARKLDNPLLDERIHGARLRSGVRMLDRRRAARGIFETLERKGIVVMLADQAVKPSEGLLVPFLGVPAWTTDAPARLALRFNIPIVCGFAIPEGERLRIVIAPLIDPAALESPTPESLTARMNEAISAQIRATPELWLWMHDRWKGSGERQEAARDTA